MSGSIWQWWRIVPHILYSGTLQERLQARWSPQKLQMSCSIWRRWWMRRWSRSTAEPWQVTKRTWWAREVPYFISIIIILITINNIIIVTLYHCHSVTLAFITPSIHVIININIMIISIIALFRHWHYCHLDRNHNHYCNHCLIFGQPWKSLNYQNRTVILLCSPISSGDSGAVEKCRNQEPSFSVPDSVSAISVAPIDQTIRPRPAYCVQKPHGSVPGADECLTLVWNIAKSERVVANCSV